MTDSLVFTPLEIKQLLVHKCYPGKNPEQFELKIKRYHDGGYILLTKKDTYEQVPQG